MNANLLAISKKKIYTVPEGIFIGQCSLNFCWIYANDNKTILHRIELNKSFPMKSKKVHVIIIGTKAKIYEYKKENEKIKKEIDF